MGEREPGRKREGREVSLRNPHDVQFYSSHRQGMYRTHATHRHYQIRKRSTRWRVPTSENRGEKRTRRVRMGSAAAESDDLPFSSHYVRGSPPSLIISKRTASTHKPEEPKHLLRLYISATNGEQSALNSRKRASSCSTPSSLAFPLSRTHHQTPHGHELLHPVRCVFLKVPNLAFLLAGRDETDLLDGGGFSRVSFLLVVKRLGVCRVGVESWRVHP